MKYEALRDKIQTETYKIIKRNFANDITEPEVLMEMVRVSGLIETKILQIIFANIDVLCEDEEIRPWIAKEN